MMENKHKIIIWVFVIVAGMLVYWLYTSSNKIGPYDNNKPIEIDADKNNEIINDSSKFTDDKRKELSNDLGSDEELPAKDGLVNQADASYNDIIAKRDVEMIKKSKSLEIIDNNDGSVMLGGNKYSKQIANQLISDMIPASTAESNKIADALQTYIYGPQTSAGYKLSTRLTDSQKHEIVTRLDKIYLASKEARLNRYMDGFNIDRFTDKLITYNNAEKYKLMELSDIIIGLKPILNGDDDGTIGFAPMEYLYNKSENKLYGKVIGYTTANAIRYEMIYEYNFDDKLFTILASSRSAETMAILNQINRPSDGSIHKK